jgi:hypothetical protein
VGGHEHHLAVIDGTTAATLAQILPVLLLTLAVEVRRNQLHQSRSRLFVLAFFIAFGVVETVLVLSIDGSLYPFQPFDAISALTIFALLAILFRLSLSEPQAAETL